MSRDAGKNHRRSIRLPGYDYAQPGSYFVTLCAHRRACLFGEITGGKMQLNPFGTIVYSRWRDLPRQFPRLALDAFVVMPNHVHGILIIKRHPGPNRTRNAYHTHCTRDTRTRRGEASVWDTTLLSDRQPSSGVLDGTHLTDASPLQPPDVPMPTGTRPGSLAAVIQHFKSTAARQINRRRRTPGEPVWQRNYWERIIPTEREAQAIRRYIHENPARWEEDQTNPLYL